jgi:nucleotide-binding universal stress UspA family protein
MKFLVPIDFTPITRNALSHALQIQRTLGGTVELLHIISTESDRKSADEKLNEIIRSLTPAEAALIATKVKLGDIFKDIAAEADNGDAQLLVMGTHGAKGLQKLFGSYAIKVISSAQTPFIVTQSALPSPKIERIVLAVDLSKESVQIVKFAADLAKKFKAEIHIVCKPETDEWLANKLRNNINAAKLVLKQEGIVHDVITLPGKQALYTEVQQYGDQNNADLFALTHFSESILPQFDKFSQEMITNPKGTPVLIVNAKNIGNVSSKYSFLTV